jgi:diacylglycerol kinase (ATP)
MLPQALTYLEQLGAQIVNTLSIADLDGLPAQGTAWREAEINIAIAAGGDGLVGGVINHIAESRLPLGILPLGTANDIARSLEIPQDLRRAAEIIIQGHVREIDVGTARPAEQAPLHGGDEQENQLPLALPLQSQGFFAHALTVGLNVQFSRLATNVATRQRYGRLAYPFAALEVLRNHNVLEMTCTFDGLLLSSQAQDQTSSQSTLSPEPVQFRCRALQIAVINAPIFGGQLSLAIPGASLTDRLLDIVIVEDVELGNLGAAFARLFNQQESLAVDEPTWHQQFPQLEQAELSHIPGVHHVQARGVTISTNADPQDVTLDGEIRGQTPIHVHMAEQRLRVLVP